MLQSRTLRGRLVVEDHLVLYQLFAMKCLNLSQNMRDDYSALLVGLVMGSLFKFCPAQSENASQLVFDQVIAQEIPTKVQFLAGLIVSAEGLRMDQDPDEPQRTLDAFVSYMIENSSKIAQEREVAQFLALFGVGYLEKADEQAVHDYLIDYVNRAGDAEMCTYLVRKCSFTPDEFTVPVGKQGLDTSLWN